MREHNDAYRFGAELEALTGAGSLFKFGKRFSPWRFYRQKINESSAIHDNDFDHLLWLFRSSKH